MPGRTQHVSPQDLASVERALHERIARSLHALADRPLRTRVVLRLHRPQPTDDLRCAAKPAPDQALVAQTQERNVSEAGHARAESAMRLEHGHVFGGISASRGTRGSELACR